MMHEGGGEGVDKEERTVWGGVKGGLARWSIRWRAQEGKISVGGGYCDGGEKCFLVMVVEYRKSLIEWW